MQGRWNITAGQNALFDAFDCQVHDWEAPDSESLKGQLRWRINKSDGDFISRQALFWGTIELARLLRCQSGMV